MVGVVREGAWRLGAGYAKDGKRLSGYQGAGYQYNRVSGKRTEGGWVNALMSGCVSSEE